MTNARRQAEVVGDLGKVSRHPEVTRAQAYIREQGEEIATLRKQAVEQEAQAAALREPLKEVLTPLWALSFRMPDGQARDELAALVDKIQVALSTAAGQALLDKQRELEEALIETSAHADWLWVQARSGGMPERLWRDQPQASQDMYRVSARNKLIDKGLVKP